MKRKWAYVSILLVAVFVTGCWSRKDYVSPPRVVIWVWCFQKYDHLAVDGERVDAGVFDGTIIAYLDKGHHVLTGRFDGKDMEFPFETFDEPGDPESYHYLECKSGPPQIRPLIPSVPIKHVK